MNKRVVILFGAIFSTICSCDDSELTADEFTVVVESTADFACSLPLIRFTDNIIKVKSKTLQESLVFNAYHLADSLNMMGATLIVQFEDVDPAAYRVCNTLGLGYPEITIVSARRDK